MRDPIDSFIAAKAFPTAEFCGPLMARAFVHPSNVALGSLTEQC